MRTGFVTHLQPGPQISSINCSHTYVGTVASSWRTTAGRVNAFTSHVDQGRHWSWGPHHEDVDTTCGEDCNKAGDVQSGHRVVNLPLSAGVAPSEHVPIEAPADELDKPGSMSIADILTQSAHYAAVKAEERREQQQMYDVAPSDEASTVRGRLEWLLARRAYTRKRLEDKMLYKGFSPESVTWALDCVEVRTTALKYSNT